MGIPAKGQVKQFTDEQLRADIALGLKPAEIATKRNVSRQAVYKRVNQLKLTTTSAAVAPEESRRFVGEQIDAIQQLMKSLQRVNKLMDSCDEWLQDANDPEKYDLNPRSGEVDVTYEVEITGAEQRLIIQKRKKRFSELCAILGDGHDEDGARFVGVVKGEHKHADPRELILKTAQEARQTVTAAAELAKMLVDMRAMEIFRETLLSEIRKVSPDIASNIAEAVRRSIVLNAAFGGIGQAGSAAFAPEQRPQPAGRA